MPSIVAQGVSVISLLPIQKVKVKVSGMFPLRGLPMMFCKKQLR